MNQQLKLSNSQDAWSETWGGDSHEYCSDMLNDSNNNIYITGITESYGIGNLNIFLLKYNDLGTLLWSRIWGEINSNYGYYLSLAIDSLNDIYIAGLTNSYGSGKEDFLLIKFNSTGAKQWFVTWGGNDTDICRDIGIDSENNIYLIGESSSVNPENITFCLVKFDNTGTQLWNYTWGSENLQALQEIDIDTNDVIYIIGGIGDYGFHYHKNNTILFRCDLSGNFVWNKTWKTPYTSYMGKRFCRIDQNHNIITSDNQMLCKFDSSGNLIWNTTQEENISTILGMGIDSHGNIYNLGFKINLCSYGPCFFGGCLCSSCFYLSVNKYDNEGFLKWGKFFYNRNSHGVAILIDSFDNVYIAGHRWKHNLKTLDIILLKNPPEFIPPNEIYFDLGYLTVPLITIFIVFLLIRRGFKNKKNRNW